MAPSESTFVVMVPLHRMMNYIFLFTAVLLTSLDAVVSQYDSGVENELSDTQAEKEQYGDYTELGNHHTSPERGSPWRHSPYPQKIPDSQLQGSESQNTLAHSLLSDSSTAKSLYKLVPDWPDPSKHVGQLSAVSIDTDGNIVVFHRGDRTWGSQTFLLDNTFSEISLGPIKQSTVIVFNATTGHVLYEWGNNIFYLPHGLTVDSENNVWVTDVALHQVFMFKRNQWKKPALILGTKFVPGNDDTHFCKPTDVAILSNGDFFVSDGYCNSRIIKFDISGQKLMEWGRNILQGSLDGIGLTAYTFSLPHALAVAEEKETLFLADRENGRILSFNITSGYFLYEIQSPDMGHKLFSVAYSPSQGGQLYVVNGPNMQRNNPIGGFQISLTVPKPITKFTGSLSLKNPHDIAVTADGHEVYIVELNPFKIWKFYDGNKTVAAHTIGKTVVNSEEHNSSNKQHSEVSNPAQLRNSITETSGTIDKHLGSVAMAVSIVLAVAVVVSIVIIAAITRMRKRGGSRDFDSLGHEYSKLVN
ncbi:peptidyl-alpha-hydroxyglycine alpha-amidating lyase 1 isoform X1 [Schistocerca cancellata]|uniref:peptidyl-alpha-hydroxyglycine alpha-amidating lyase 1 isoform X1 n=2 Tax=Schistocerca cancellata TaxID=274614 RepID=UPI002117392D|nr:peptidyl-alpha-hydroxyglycine alpha-amidating lyase 1 isoform X1 [Schistocerca cancellata]